MMKISVLFAITLSAVNGWNYETHFLIGRIAYDLLKERSPEALNNAEDVLRLYSDMVTVDNEKDYPFVECIIYADAIKQGAGKF